MKGARVQAIVRELSNERIDIVPWCEDEAMFLSRALSPARVVRVAVDRKEHRMAALVDEDQLSLAIGKSGQNARLAAQLTGWRIDIMTEEEYQDRQRERQATRIPLEQVEGLDEATVANLIAARIETANELASKYPDELEDIPGMTEETAEQMIQICSLAVKEAVKEFRAVLEAERAAAAAEAAQASEAEAEALERDRRPDEGEVGEITEGEGLEELNKEGEEEAAPVRSEAEGEGDRP